MGAFVARFQSTFRLLMRGKPHILPRRILGRWRVTSPLPLNGKRWSKWVRGFQESYFPGKYLLCMGLFRERKVFPTSRAKNAACCGASPSRANIRFWGASCPIARRRRFRPRSFSSPPGSRARRGTVLPACRYGRCPAASAHPRWHS